MKTLGTWVRSLRQARGMSQAQLQAETGIGQTYISDIEAGKTKLPSPDHRRRIAAALGTSNVDLLLAAGEVDEEELTAWAHRRGFTLPDATGTPRHLALVAGELAAEGQGSSRAELALLIPSLTHQEARFFIDTVPRLPTEAGRKRATLSTDEYQRWRDGEDARWEREQMEQLL